LSRFFPNFIKTTAFKNLKVKIPQIVQHQTTIRNGRHNRHLAKKSHRKLPCSPQTHATEITVKIIQILFYYFCLKKTGQKRKGKKEGENNLGKEWRNFTAERNERGQ
jgi:hypothetical protein